MKLVYITSYTFPSRRAEPYYIKSMAGAFMKALGRDFTLCIRGRAPDELSSINTKSINLPESGRTILYFLLFPLFVLRMKWNHRDMILMSNDPYLLVIAIVWRVLCRYEYRICADWHQLFDDWKDAFISKRSEYHISTCNRLKECIVKRCMISAERISVAYGGIDLRYFPQRTTSERMSLRQELGLPADKYLVAYVGGFKSVGHEKGLTTMIKALPFLDDRIQVVLVGGSPADISEYSRIAEEYGVGERCTLIKKQQFEKVAAYESAMDVLVIPYPDQHHFRDYGFPMKVWEYMASARPIVYSNLEIIDEALSERGTPFTPDDPKSFSEAIHALYTNQGRADMQGQKNAQDVRAYTWDARVATILRYFDTMQNTYA